MRIIHRLRHALIGFCAALTLGMGNAQAPSFDLLQTFANPKPAAESQFGYAVAMVAGNVLVGAPFDDEEGTGAGAAYLLDAKTGAVIRTFHSPNPAAGDWFGIAVAAVGNNVLVGALGDDTGAHDAGAAYLFDGATGALLRAFQKPTPAADDWFGGAVAAVGNDVLVGAPLDDTGAVDAGAAYLFDGATGALMRTFKNPTPHSGDWFGVSLATTSTRVMIGAMLDDGAGTDAGAVHLFDRATGALVKSITAPGGAGDWFGVAIAASGDSFIVGAPFNDAGAQDAGAAYRFDGSAGALLQSLPSPVPLKGDNFGRSVAAIGNTVLIGSPGDGTGKVGGGVWVIGEGLASTLIRNPRPDAGDQFGFAVAADNSQFVVGAPMDAAGEANSGSAYLFRPR